MGGGGGRGGGRTPPFSPPQGFDPVPTQRVPPLVLFKISIFGRPTLKFSKGAFGANIYIYILILRGGARQKKRNFFGQNSPKSAKNAFFGLFFQNFKKFFKKKIEKISKIF